MSCTCCSERQSSFQCGQVPSARHSPSSNSNGQLVRSCVHTCHPAALPLTNCIPSGGCGCHHYHHLSCAGCSPGHTHLPAVASPLVHAHHQVQSPMAIVHPHYQRLDPTPSCQSKSSPLYHSNPAPPHKEVEPSPLNESNFVQRLDPLPVQRSSSTLQGDTSPITRSKSHPRLEPSPLSRPHPRRQRHPSGNNRPHLQHREQLFQSENDQSSGFPLQLDFSPASVKDCSLTTSGNFLLGVATESPPSTSLRKSAIDVPQVVHDETINYGIQADVTVPPPGPRTSDPPVPVPAPPTKGVRVATTMTETAVSVDPVVEVVEVDPAPCTTPTNGAKRKGQSPILLHKWWFKVIAREMVVLLGYKSQDIDEMKWRSGPLSERLSSSLLMTRSGQIYHLMGLLNTEEMTKESPQLSKQVLRKFRKGFPTQWMKLLQEKKSPNESVSKQKSSKRPTLQCTSSVPDLSKVKKEKKESTASSTKKQKETALSDPSRMMTPVMSETTNTPKSSFVNSLKRSSRGRTIKPARSTVSPCLQSCSDLYSYDWHGNFTGITSVIDLTSDDPLPPSRRSRSIKKEPVEKTTPNQASVSFNSTSTIAPPTGNTSAPPPLAKTKQSRKSSKENVARTLASPAKKSVTLHRGDYEVEVVCDRQPIVKIEGRDRLTKLQVKGQPKRSKPQNRSLVKVDRRSDKKNRHGDGHGEQWSIAGRVGGDRGWSNCDSRDAPGLAEWRERGGEVATNDSRAHRSRSSSYSSLSEVLLQTNVPAVSDESEVEYTRPKRRGQRRKPRPASARNEEMDSETSVLDLSLSMTCPAPSKKGRKENRAMCYGGLEILGDREVVDNKMSDRDLKILREVVHSVPALTSNFWEVVAKRLGTGHTAQQCSSAYHEQTNKMKPPSLRPKKKEVSNDSLVESSHQKRTKSKGRSVITMPDERSEVEHPEKKKGRSRPGKLHPSSPTKESRHKEMDSDASVCDSVSVSSPAKRRRREAERSRIQMLHDSGMFDVGDQLGDELSGRDLRNLKQVVHSVPALTSNFWEVVAKRLGTGHTAQQCSSAYHEQTNKMKPPSLRPKKKEKGRVETSITAKTGTLKRKRQLRDALEHLDNDYYDDIFNSTPLKKIKKSVKIPESHDDYFEGEENNPPRMMYTPSVAHTRVGAPHSQTPNLCDYLTTPDLKCGLKRDVADHVIYNAQKAQKGSKRRGTFQKPSVSKSFICEQKLRNIRTGELTTLRMFEDSDDSSNDEADDILTML